MKIAPVAPVQKVPPRITVGTLPQLEAFVVRVQDVTDHTPDRSINVLVFSSEGALAREMVDQLLSHPSRWRHLRIELYPERVEELDFMASLGLKRVAFSNVEIQIALKSMERRGYGYWRTQTLTPGMQAIKEIAKWHR